MTTTDSDLKLDAPPGHGRRLALVALVVIVLAAALLWLWPDRGRGEPDQAHRVLIVGGTPSDLVSVIAEAGFDSEQRTWDQAEAEVSAAEGSFDLDALIGYADERGYGFVAVMRGDDAPSGLLAWPEGARAVVVSVGDLAGDDRVVHPGGVTEGVEFPAGLARAEALRAALYEHPDLLRLWDDPSPEQMQQQIQLGKLDDARRLTALARERYEAAAAWPGDWPEDALVAQWTSLTALPVEGGVLVDALPRRPVATESREVRLESGELRPLFVPASARPNDLDAGRPRAPLDLAKIRRSPGGRALAVLDGNFAELYQLESGELVRTGSVELPAIFDHVLSDHGMLAAWELTGELAWAGPERRGSLLLGPGRVDLLAWAAPGTLAASVELNHPGSPEHDLIVLSLDLESSAASEAPAVGGLTLSPDLLVGPADRELVLGSARVRALVPVPGSPSLLVSITYEAAAGRRPQRLLRIDLDDAALRSRSLPALPALPEDPLLREQAMLDGELLRRMAVPPGEAVGVRVRDLGLIPPHGELVCTPGGEVVAWRGVGERGGIWAAPIEGDTLGEAVELDAHEPVAALMPMSSGPQLHVSPDGRALLVNAIRELPTGELRYLRRLELPGG